ncbi:MAG: peptidyl-prolyl cis-trans isomerase, partial [Pseudomonadota bacterium]
NAINAHRNEQRKLSYAIVPITAVPMPATPDDAAVKKFYEENPSQFTAPEFRNSVVLELTAQALSETIEVSEEELTARFAVERQRFERAERRTVEQINFPTKEAAEKAAKEIADGKDFYEVAEAAGNARADVNLGPRTKASLAVPAIRDAAFGLEVNEISAPVEAPLATSLVRVTAITPGVTVTLDDVREQIMSAVRQDKAGDEINALYDQVEDRRSEGATLAEIGKALNLPVKEFRAIDRQGNGVDGESVEGVLEPARVLPAIFAGQPGVEANPTELANGGFAWVDVLSIEASKLKTLDDVKAEATTALQEQLRRDALVALTDKIVADMRSGKALEAALTAALPDAAAP